MAEQQIVAMGGGGTSDAVLGEVFALAGRERARVLYVGTASAEDPRNTLIMYELARGQADVTPLKFFPWPPADLRELTLAQDVIFVGGGNTANMLAIWRVHGFDRILREAWEQGIVLSGSSAGMICWFEASVTDSFGPAARGDERRPRVPAGERLPPLRRRGAAAPVLPRARWRAAFRPGTPPTRASASTSSARSSSR